MQGLQGLVPFLLIALVFWFLIVRPQRRRAQALAATQSTLDVGSEVMLGSGIYCTVVSLEDETIHVEVAPGTVVKVARQAVAKVLDNAADHGFEERPKHEYDEAPPDLRKEPTDLRGDERPGPTNQP